MKIFTVYRPEEHVDYLEEWISYHQKIGVENFYLYDNGGSTGYGTDGVELIPHTDSKKRISRYGFRIKYSPEEAREKESKFINKYPVTKVLWQPTLNGQVVYGYTDAVIDFINRVKSGLCAFIDVDEFIVKKEEFRSSRLYQRIFKNYNYFNSIFESKEMFSLETLSGRAVHTLTHEYSKCILDISNFSEFDKLVPNTMHFMNFNLPLSESFFNHYNFNKLKYGIFRKTIAKEDWKIKSYEECTKYIENPFEESIVKINVP